MNDPHLSRLIDARDALRRAPSELARQHLKEEAAAAFALADAAAFAERSHLLREGDPTLPEAVAAVLTKTPSAELLTWADQDTARLALLLRHAALDDAAWGFLLTHPILTNPRPGIPIKYLNRAPSPRPPLIRLALDNPHLPPALRAALLAAQA